jgi:5-methylcytosine-specific restriction protein A
MLAAFRPCRHAGCSALIQSGTHCEQHASEAGAWGGKRWSGSTTDRGYGWQWVKLRRQILKRDGYLCQACRIRSADHVHHIKPKSEGGLDVPENLVSWCEQCHEEWHRTNKK